MNMKILRKSLDMLTTNEFYSDYICEFLKTIQIVKEHSKLSKKYIYLKGSWYFWWILFICSTHLILVILVPISVLLILKKVYLILVFILILTINN